jgi:hypothetical protein
MKETKPRIELKNVKHMESLSHETYAYTATIYVDDKRWASVSNEGQGGPDSVYPLRGSKKTYSDIRAELKELNKRIAATFDPLEDSYGNLEQDLELVCGELVSEYLCSREFRRARRKYLLFTTSAKPGVFQIKRPLKDRTNQTKAALSARHAEETLQFLDDLPEAEAIKLFSTA